MKNTDVSNTNDASLKILIIGPNWVGDMVMAQTLFILLKNMFPRCSIDVMAPKWTQSLLSRMPEVNNSIVLPFSHGQLALCVRRKLGLSLKNQYDWCIVLPNSLKSALIPFFANIRKRTGFVGEMRYGFLNNLHRLDKQKLSLMIERFMVLASEDEYLPRLYPKPDLRIDNNNLQKCIIKFNLNTNKKILGVCPGAEFGLSKKYPTEQYAYIIYEKLKAGMCVWIFGSQKDMQTANEIISIVKAYAEQDVDGYNILSKCANLAGKTDMKDVIDLLSLCSVVVSNDSGLLHVAAAVSVPVIAIYGSTSPEFTPPLAQKKQIVRLNNLECSPCFKRTCRFGHYNCLKNLSPQVVIEAIDKYVTEETCGGAH